MKKALPGSTFLLISCFMDGVNFFWKCLGGSSKVCLPNRPTAITKAQATSPLLWLARCARVIPRSRSACGLAHLGKGAASPPVASPGPGASLRGPHQTRFAFWTSDRGDFISPWTFDHGGLRARPGPPDRGRLRSPSGHPSTRLSQPWTAPGAAAALEPVPLLFAVTGRAAVNSPLTKSQVSSLGEEALWRDAAAAKNGSALTY